MSTAFVFAPLSSVLRPEDRSRYRHLGEVRARFASAAGILRDRAGVRVCFDDLINQPSAGLCDRARVHLTAALVLTMQMGVVDRLAKLLPKPAWVAGCSLGDVARTVTAGACAFETALHALLRALHEVVGADQVGSTVVVMTTPRHPFTPEDLAWFASVDLTISQLSDRLLNVAGLNAALQALKDKAQERHWRIFPLLDFPLHSRHVAGYTKQATELIGHVPFDAPATGTRVYSSVLKREVKEPEDFREVFLGSLVLPHNWKDTVDDLVENHAVTSFVNIGPCRTLSKLLEETGQDVLEAYDLIEAETAAASSGRPASVRVLPREI
jgi:malonyl CoA-acyl carrier protein transacylase